jgi:hypothetical protein
VGVSDHRDKNDFSTRNQVVQRLPLWLLHFCALALTRPRSGADVRLCPAEPFNGVLALDSSTRSLTGVWTAQCTVGFPRYSLVFTVLCTCADVQMVRLGSWVVRFPRPIRAVCVLARAQGYLRGVVGILKELRRCADVHGGGAAGLVSCFGSRFLSSIAFHFLSGP